MSFKETHPAKWLILPLCIISCFGIEFAFDNPGVLKELLTQSFKSKYNPEQFEIYYSLLYSCLALPNIIVPFIIGYLIDILNVRNLYILLMILSVIGQALVSLGVACLSLWIIYTGRMIFGIACGSITIVQGIFLNQYFSQDRMSLIVGGIYSLANLGGMINSYFTPSIAVKHGLTAPFWLGTLGCGVIGLFALFGCYIDKKIEAQEEEQKRPRIPTLEDLEESCLLTDIEQLQMETTRDNEFGHSKAKLPSLHDLKEFPLMFWYICLGTFLVQGSIQSFDIIGASYIKEKWFFMENIKAATQDSGRIFSMYKLSSFIFSPFLGYLVDKTGERSLFLMFASIMTLASHILFTIIRPLIPCMLMGMGSTLVYSACWPSIMRILKKEHLGKACGLITSLENIGLLVFPLVDGWLKNAFGSYDDSQIFLAMLALGGTMFTIKSYLLDMQQEEENLMRIKVKLR